MATIPQHGDPTLEAMLKAVEDAQQFEDRPYLGASQIGDPCARKIWYNYNNYPRRKSSAIGLIAADSGYYAEDITAARLRLLPFIELHTHMPDGKQYGWSAHGGKMKGHYDGLIRGLLQAPKAVHVWEHKDKNHTKFADFQNKKAKYGEKSVLKHWDETYYGQAQINMHFARLDGMAVDRHYMTVSYAGARKYDSCRTEYDEDSAFKLVDKAHKIIEATQEPQRISDKPDFYLCRFCDYKDICHA